MSVAETLSPKTRNIEQRLAVSRASDRAARFERRLALTVVLTPVIGLLAAIYFFWEQGVTWVEIGLLVGMYTLTMSGISLGYHRLVSHGSFQTYRGIRALWAIFGSMAAQGPVLTWACIHRRHHMTSDRAGDPHSPNYERKPGVINFIKGFWHAHIGWMFNHEVTDWSRYIMDLLKDPLLIKVHRLYFFWIFLGLAIPAVIGGLIAGTWMGALTGFLWGGLIRILLVHHFTWCVNSLCHVMGTRPFRAPDMSRNNLLIVVAALGEGWHNNHHAFPYSALHGLRWYQFDFNATCIRTAELFGLAWKIKKPTPKAIEDAKRGNTAGPDPEALACNFPPPE